MYRNMPPKRVAENPVEEQNKLIRGDPATIIIESVNNYFRDHGIKKEYYINDEYITIYLYFLKGEKKIYCYYLTFLFVSFDDYETTHMFSSVRKHAANKAFQQHTLGIKILTLQSVLNGLGLTYAVISELFAKTLQRGAKLATLEDTTDQHGIESIYVALGLHAHEPTSIKFRHIREHIDEASIESYFAHIEKTKQDVLAQHEESKAIGSNAPIEPGTQTSESSYSPSQQTDDVSTQFSSTGSEFADAIVNVSDSQKSGSILLAVTDISRWLPYYLSRKPILTVDDMASIVIENTSKPQSTGWVFSGPSVETGTLIFEKEALSPPANLITDSHAMVEGSQGSEGGKSKKSIKKKSNIKKLHYTKKPKQRKSKKKLRIFTMKKRKTK